MSLRRLILLRKKNTENPTRQLFLGAATKLQVSPENCLAFEDSLVGVLAAKSAKMKCVAVPEPRLQDNPRFVIADLILPSLKEFTASHWENLALD